MLTPSALSTHPKPGFMYYHLTMNKESIYKRVSFLLLILGPITTLFVSPWSNFDPINLIKLLAVSSISFAACALTISARDKVRQRHIRNLVFSSLFFVSWMMLVVFLSGAPVSQQIWGVFGRNTGFLTYLSLIFVLVAVALVQEHKFYWRLVESFILVSVPVTVYALIQVAGRDPVKWSLMAPFATLGNINFSSAFFGLSSVCTIVMISQRSFKPIIRIFFLIVVCVELLIILQSGSIQGLMIFVAGVGIAGFLWLRSRFKNFALQGAYLLVAFISVVATSLALFNIGPLAKFVFSETILFRFDYWYAGWVMALNKPIFGVGMDSYGDWYRQVRGEVATFRTNPDRITNSAHNIYLDVLASGGFPLLIAYLFILGLALRAAIRVIRRSKDFDPCFVAMFAAWLSYLIQAAISINQIGVGVWGWLFTGSLVGYEIATREKAERARKSRKLSWTVTSPMPASSALIGIFGFALGFTLAFIPFSADAKFKSAYQMNSIEAMKISLGKLGSTAYHAELTLDATLKQNNELAAKAVMENLLTQYPRNFMGWRVKALLPSVSIEDRKAAQDRLHVLDPFNNTLAVP